MVNNNNLSTLNKEEALEKFIEGKDIWNEYIDKHPDANIDFSYVDFSGRREEGEPFDFSGYKFPKKGNVDFSDANFGKGDVNFWEAEFGKGDVNFNRAIFGEKEECSDCSSVGFTGATFGEGNISFLNTQLGQNATVFFDLATFGKGRVSFKDSEVVNGDISFRAVVFGEGKVGFSNAKFGNGRVDFSNAKFGNGRVDFTSAELGHREVIFDKAEFGDQGVCFCDVDFCKTNTDTINGEVTFEEVTFGKGAVDFEHAKFGKGTVSFDKSSFGDGDVNFKDAKFDEGDVKFNDVDFGEGSVKFNDVDFGEGNVDFSGADFGEGNVNFHGANFGEGSVNFSYVQFVKGIVSFHHAKFSKGIFFGAKFGEADVSFYGAEFGEGDVDFRLCEFKGNIDFRELKDINKLSSFSLRNSIFNKSLDMSDNSFNCIPDLTNTKLTNQVSLDRMNVNPPNTYKGGDGERLCRLKEISEDNKNYQQALGFHVMEMRAKRHKLHKWDRRFDCLFDTIATYGNSITSPMIYLLCTTLSFTYIYASMSIVEHAPAHWYDWIDRFLIGFLYSLSQVLPFVSAGRNSANDSLKQLFPCETIPTEVYYFSLFQGVLSFVLLFLIGLGFRNRFRL